MVLKINTISNYNHVVPADLGFVDADHCPTVPVAAHLVVRGELRATSAVPFGLPISDRYAAVRSGAPSGANRSSSEHVGKWTSTEKRTI